VVGYSDVMARIGSAEITGILRVFRTLEWAKVQIHEEADCRATQSSHATAEQELLRKSPRWCDHLLDLHRHDFSIGDAGPGRLGIAAKYSRCLAGTLGS
jgi:hypothetical protein